LRPRYGKQESVDTTLIESVHICFEPGRKPAIADKPRRERNQRLTKGDRPISGAAAMLAQKIETKKCQLKNYPQL